MCVNRVQQETCKCRHTCSRVCRACRAVCYGRRAKQYQPSMSLEHNVPSASTLRGTSKQCKSRFAKVGTALCLTQPDNHEAPFDACSRSPGLGLISMRSCPYSLCGLCVWHPLVMGVTLISRLGICFLCGRAIHYKYMYGQQKKPQVSNKRNFMVLEPVLFLFLFPVLRVGEILMTRTKTSSDRNRKCLDPVLFHFVFNNSDD